MSLRRALLLGLAAFTGCAEPASPPSSPDPAPANSPAASKRDSTMKDLKARFDELTEAWEAHRQSVMFSSNTRDYVDCPAYRDIVALGRGAVPLILERYQGDDELPWELALQEITGERMIEDLDSYRPDDVKKKWLAWWERNRASFQR